MREIRVYVSSTVVEKCPQGCVPLIFCDVNKFAKTQTSNWLASSLVRAPNTLSGGNEFESPVWIDPRRGLKSFNSALY